MTKVVVAVIAAGTAVWYVVIPLFERFAPASIVRAYQRVTMPAFRPIAGVVPGYGVIETIGRRTGKRRRVPVGGKLDGDAFWFVAGVGERARYVYNIKADPNVRIKTRGRWRSGTAHLCPEDDARKRALRVSPTNGLFLLVANARPLTIRVDLDPS